MQQPGLPPAEVHGVGDRLPSDYRHSPAPVSTGRGRGDEARLRTIPQRAMMSSRHRLCCEMLIVSVAGSFPAMGGPFHRALSGAPPPHIGVPPAMSTASSSTDWRSGSPCGIVGLLP